MKAVFYAPNGIGGELNPPPDKSLTHRALMLGAVSDGACLVRNSLNTGDCLVTRRCLSSLGVSISETGERKNRNLRIEGLGLTGFREPEAPLDAGNSGTTLRLLAGLLAGLPIYTVMVGDRSLMSRPMLRVVEPLRRMGAAIAGRASGEYAPLSFLPGDGSLSPIDYELTIPSAQVKSAILFAALRSTGKTVLRGCLNSRDHTEKLFNYLQLPISTEEDCLILEPVSRIPAFDVKIPGDPSSAAFFITAALISGREITVYNCGINPTRMGFYEVLRRMGARIEIVEESSSGNEPIGSIHIKPDTLHGVSIKGSEVPFLIDEIPLIAVLAAFAQGCTEVRGAKELRHKESDRIEAVSRFISALGGSVTVHNDGFSLEGPQLLSGGVINSEGDHRIAMAAAVLSAGVRDKVEVHGFEAASVSFPNFLDYFRNLGGKVE